VPKKRPKPSSNKSSVTLGYPKTYSLTDCPQIISRVWRAFFQLLLLKLSLSSEFTLIYTLLVPLLGNLSWITCIVCTNKQHTLKTNKNQGNYTYIKHHKNNTTRLSRRFRRLGDSCGHIVTIAKTVGAISFLGPSMH